MQKLLMLAAAVVRKSIPIILIIFIYVAALLAYGSKLSKFCHQQGFVGAHVGWDFKSECLQTR